MAGGKSSIKCFGYKVLPSGPGNSRAEFGPSRERSKKLTRVPTGGTLHHLLPRSYNYFF